MARMRTPRARRLRHQLDRRVGAVGGGRVRVEVDAARHLPPARERVEIGEQRPDADARRRPWARAAARAR